MSTNSKSRIWRTPSRSEAATELLNLFLRGELAAAATYDQALRHVHTVQLRTRLEQNRRSHAGRTTLLAQKVRAHGGKPAQRPGAWGVLSKLLEGSAAIFGERAVLRALHEGETYGMSAYLQRATELPEEDKHDLFRHVIGEQKLTELRLRELIDALA